MIQPDKEESWYASRYYFWERKAYQGIFRCPRDREHIYDVKQEYWDKNKKKESAEGSSLLCHLILSGTTRIEAEGVEVLLSK